MGLLDTYDFKRPYDGEKLLKRLIERLRPHFFVGNESFTTDSNNSDEIVPLNDRSGNERTEDINGGNDTDWLDVAHQDRLFVEAVAANSNDSFDVLARLDESSSNVTLASNVQPGTSGGMVLDGQGISKYHWIQVRATDNAGSGTHDQKVRVLATSRQGSWILGDRDDPAAGHDSDGSVIAHLRQFQKAFGDETATNAVIQTDPNTATNHLDYERGLLDLFTTDTSTGPARTAAQENIVESGTDQTNDSYTTITDGSTPATISVSRQTMVTVVAENLNGANNVIPADFKIQGRINNPNGNASSWVDVQEVQDVSHGSAVRMEINEAGMTNYRVQARDGSGSNTTDVKAFLLARGN